MKLQPLPALLLSIILSASLLTRAQIPATGLVAYWPMNGNFNDAGPNAINGTNFSATSTTNKLGSAASAMNFNNPGSSVVQYGTHPVNTALNFGAAQNFTLSFLTFINSPLPHPVGLYDNNLNYGGYGVYFWQPAANATFQFNFRNQSVSSTAQPVGQWLHVCCVRNAGTLSIYINGLFNASIATGTATPAYLFPARFGSMFFNSLIPPQYNGMHGKIDELRIYNRALTATEIAQMASIVLPVQLSRFTGTKTNDGVRLDWTTASEENSDYFLVEKSRDQNNWTVRGQVNTAAQPGGPTHYSFSDPEIVTGTVFYRLKMVDRDGSFRYSPVVAVRAGTILQPILFPNPADQWLHLQLPAYFNESVKIRIIAVSGKQVKEQVITSSGNSNSISIDIRHLSKGTYYLSVQTASGIVTRSFVKQ
jgi:Concanavalin A-like lectin/glucanases superfamily/Secretion system C-terminal sorting domain